MEENWTASISQSRVCLQNQFCGIIFCQADEKSRLESMIEINLSYASVRIQPVFEILGSQHLWL